jgi:phytoene synthase
MNAPLGAELADLAEVERIVRDAGTSFYRGMRILPPDRRMAMYAIYAFCRVVDDIADDEGPFAAKAPLLDGWRGRIAALYRGEGETDGPVTRVLLRAVRQYALRQADFEAVIDGMQMDAQTTIVAPDLATLDLYCDRVAAAVGRLSVRAFGDSSADADAVAWALGRALQLTNILRDVHEDAGRGRLYLPREWLADASVPLDPAGALAHPDLPLVCERVAQAAHGHFRAARDAMRRCDRRAMRPARLMGATYAAVLDRLERRGWRELHRPVKVGKLTKLWIVARYGLT